MRTLFKQPLLPVLARLLLLAFDLIPIHQLDWWRDDASECRALDGFEALAGAGGDVVLVAFEGKNFAVGGLALHAIDVVGDEGAADAVVVLLQLDADHALAHACEQVNLVDGEVKHAAFGAGEKQGLLATPDRGQDHAVAFIEADVAPAELV